MGALAWITLDTPNDPKNILTFAIIGGMAAGAMNTLSPVLLLFIAYTLPMLCALEVKVWLMHDPAFNALWWAWILYFGGLAAQALNISRFARKTIETNFALEESHRKLREIEQREMLAQERQRLMQDMHDGVGSSLTSALRVAEHGKISEADMVLVLKGCIDDLKLAIDSMEPVDSDLLLLLATLRFRLQPRLENTGITLCWEVRDVPKLDWLDPKTALHILRILQEAFINIIKHTQATEIRVSTSADGDFVDATITDNGQGFDVESALSKGGKGLSNQVRRAEAIGAGVRWKSGTRFILRLPIKW